MLEILTVDELCRRYKLSRGFIKNHRIELGGRAGKYDAELVESFLREYFRDALQKKKQEEAERQRRSESIEKKLALFPQTRKYSSESAVGKINGKFVAKGG